MTDQTEKRKQSRAKVTWPVHVITDYGTIKGEATNISTEGIFIRCEEPLRMNETYQMSVSPQNFPALAITGKVIWSDLYGIGDDNAAYGMGICLVKISDEDRQHLNDIVSAKLRRKEKRE